MCWKFFMFSMPLDRRSGEFLKRKVFKCSDTPSGSRPGEFTNGWSLAFFFRVPPCSSLSPPRANRLLMRGHILKRKGRKTKKGNTKREGMKKKKRQKREEKRNRQYKKNRHIITKRRTHKQKRKQHNKTITENITKHKQLNLTEKQIKWKEKRKTKRKEKHKKKRSKHREIIIIELPSFHILKTLRERFFWQKMDFPFFS